MERQGDAALRSKFLTVEWLEKDYYLGWADRFPDVSHAHIPAGIVAASRCAFAPKRRAELLRYRFTAERTNRLARRSPQRQTSFHPTSVDDIVQPVALRRVRNFLRKSAADLEAMSAGKPNPRHARAPIVIAQNEVHAPARGVVWSLRNLVTSADGRGFYAPVDHWETPLRSRLNVAFLAQELAEYPDKASSTTSASASASM